MALHNNWLLWGLICLIEDFGINALDTVLEYLNRQGHMILINSFLWLQASF